MYVIDKQMFRGVTFWGTFSCVCPVGHTGRTRGKYREPPPGQSQGGPDGNTAGLLRGPLESGTVSVQGRAPLTLVVVCALQMRKMKVKTAE